MTTYIYGLCNPNSNVVMYVGKSVNPTIRYNQHMSAAASGYASPCYEWVRTLTKVGVKPRMTILDQDDGDGTELEIEWIVKMVKQNPDLLNVNDNPLRGHTSSGESKSSGMKTKTFTMRVSEKTLNILSHLSETHGISRAKVMTFLLESELVKSPDGYLSALADNIVDRKLNELEENHHGY